MEREISILLKVKGAKAAKKAVTDVFNNQTTTLVEGFTKKTKKAGDSVDRLGKKSKSTSKSMNSFTKVLGRGMAALYLYNRAWDVFGKNFESGMQLDRASDQFERNVGNVADMMPVLRSATKGVIADFDLLKTANRAFQQGIKPEAMGRTFKLATVAAQRLGLSATDAINTITNAVTKQDEGALNTLGVVTKVNQAYKTQAALIAKNGGVMSQAMSIQLRQSLIMKELESRFGGVNKVQNDGLAVLERLRASWKNFRAVLGQTIGISLRPLITTLTGVLDVTTKLLDKLNDVGGFRKFVQLATTLGLVFGGMKFISGARTVMSLFGFLSGSNASRVPKVLKKTNVLMGALGGVVTKKMPALSKFTKWMTRVLRLGGSFARTIPGWGLAISAVMFLIDPLVGLFKTAWRSAKMFFNLLSSFDENSGLSKVLKKDVDDLGVFYKWVESAAKISLEFWAVVKGIGQGIGDAFQPITTAISWAKDQLAAFGVELLTIDGIAARSTSRLDAITRSVRALTGILAPLIGGALTGGMLGGPLGALIGAVGGGAFSLATNEDAQALAGRAGQAIGGGITNFMDSGYAPAPAMSTGVTETPAPRAMNLEYSEDQSEILKKMSKILEKQTGIMETDSQKQDIKDSQSAARNGGILGRP